MVKNRGKRQGARGKKISGLWSGISCQKKAYHLIMFLMSLLFTFHCSPFTVFAQEPSSLKELIEEAREKNQEIQAFRHRLQAKEFKTKTEGILDDPTFKVEIMDIPTDNPFNLSDSMQTRYTIGQMFPFPGKLSSRERMAMKEALMAGAELREKELGIITMLKEAYYEYAFIVESIKLTKEIKEILEDVARSAEIRYSLGQVGQQDVIKAQVEISMLVNDILTLEAEKGVAQARVNAILNRDPPSSLPEPEEVPRGKLEMKSDELIKRAMEKNPRLSAMVYEIEAQETAVELTGKNYYPDFMIEAAPIEREGRFDSWDLMFSINIPLWRSKYYNQVSEAKAMKEVLISRLNAERIFKTFEVREVVIKVETANRIRTLYETGLLPQAELSFSSALANYQTGKVDFLTLLDNERVLKRTRIEYIRSLVDYNKGIASLEKVVGDEIW